MVSTADVICALILVVMVVVEGHRGVVLALVDFVGVLVAVLIVREAYVPLSAHFGSASAAYAVLLAIAMLLVVIAAVYLTGVTNFDVTGGDAAAGALLGACSAAVLCFAFFEVLTIRYGAGALLVSNSLVHSLFHDFAAFKAIAEFARTLGGR